MQPSIRVHDPDRPLAPDEMVRLALESLDLAWEMAIAAELAGGAASREEAELRVGERWRREDDMRLREKIRRWERLADARRSVR